MRDRIDDIRARGAELAIIGNGAPNFAQAFREDFELDGPLLCDPELRAYRAAGLRRGRVEILSPRLATNALRALAGGNRQRGVQGDPWQLGGVFVIRPDGDLTYRYLSREAGDHPPVDEILAALEPGAPTVPEDERPSLPLRLAGQALSTLIDPTIAPSFAAPGFAIHALGFDPTDLDVDLTGRHFVVTGANAGLGFETAQALADLGGDVTMLCRNAERAEAAAEQIRERTGSKQVRTEIVDMSSLASVRACAERLVKEPVDVLIHNAGALVDEREGTPEGLELTFACHVAGPHLLTRLLRPALERALDGRVIFVSSGGMYTRKLQTEDPQWSEREFDGVLAYAEAKRAQIVLSKRWARELRDSGVVVHAMHPGWAATDGVANSLPTFNRLLQPLLRTPAQGADTIVWLAVAARPATSTGRFWFDRQPRSTHYLPWTREDASERRKLWELCQSLTEPFVRD